MNHVLSAGLDSFPAALDHNSGFRDAPARNGSLAVRLLRHHTKNALQRVIAQCEKADLRATKEGAALADDIQRRIMLSVSISDALFGVTAVPANFEDRLETLVEATVSLLRDDSQKIRTGTEITGQCPQLLIPVVLRVTHELVGNAVIHGMYQRRTGTILVSLRVSSNGSLRLLVDDDGWGPKNSAPGEGTAILSEFVRAYHGSIILTRKGQLTTAEMSIPA